MSHNSKKTQIVSAVINNLKEHGMDIDTRAIQLVQQAVNELDPQIDINAKLIVNISKHIGVELFKTKHEQLPSNAIGDSETALAGPTIKATDTVNSLLTRPAVLQSIFNPGALVSRTYLFLDSRWRFRTGDSSVLSWSIATSNGPRQDSFSGLVTADLRNIVGIRLLPFIFPNTRRALNCLRRISVEMIEFQNQAYVMYGNQRFHFMYEINAGAAADDPYETKELGLNESTFRFGKPISEIQTLSFRFRNPINILSLDKDLLTGTATSVGAETVITFSEPHFCGIGDEIIVNGFNTTNPIADLAEIELVNDQDGWPITAVTTYTMTFGVDLSSLAGAIVGNVEVFFQAKRLLMRLEIDWVAK